MACRNWNSLAKYRMRCLDNRTYDLYAVMEQAVGIIYNIIPTEGERYFDTIVS